MRPLIITVAVLLVLVGGCWRLIHPPVPGDDVVVRAYRKSSAALVEISVFLTKHPELRYIAPNRLSPEDVKTISVTLGEIQEIREKLAKTGFEDVGTLFGSREIFFTYMSAGLVTGGVHKGLLYSTTEPKPIKDSLDDMGWKTYSHVTGYRHIEGPWYVYFQRD